MDRSRFSIVAVAIVAVMFAAAWSLLAPTAESHAAAGAPEGGQGVTKYVRYVHQGATSFGILEGDTVHQLEGDLIFAVDHIVSYVSGYFTLHPGDVISTGTPGSTRPMQPGDIVEVEVEGVGVLRNPVAAASGQRP